MKKGNASFPSSTKLRNNCFTFVKTNPKDIKKTLKIIALIVGGLLIFFSLVFFLLQTRGIQQLIVNTVTKDLSARLNAEVRVGEFDYEFFNVITLKDVYVEDLRQDTLLAVDELSAHFRFFQLFRKKVIFYSLQIDGLYGNLVVTPEGENNFDFLIDLFRPDPDKERADIEYAFRNVRLTNSALAYNNQAASGKEHSSESMDFNHLYIDGINAELNLNIWRSDTINAAVTRFTAREKSGLEIVDFSIELVGDTSGMTIPFFRLHLPHSRLNLEKLSFRYGEEWESVDDFINDTHFQGALNNTQITLSDVAPLLPAFQGMDALVFIEASANGYLSNLRVPKIKINYGESFLLNASLNLSGLPDLDEVFLYGDIKELKLQSADMENFLTDVTDRDFNLPEVLKTLGAVNYSGNISGFLSNMVLYGNLQSHVGDISTDILVQFENDFQDIRYNGTVESKSLDLGGLLQMEELGNIAFHINTTGGKQHGSPIQGTIDATVPEFNLKGYAYTDINFNGRYDGNGFNGSLRIEDENINAHFDGLIDLTAELPVFDFDLKVTETNLNALNLIKAYPNALLSFNWKTNMTGNSLDNINGFVRFDSIVFVNEDRRLDVDEVQFISRTDKDYTNFVIESKYLNGSLSGNFNYGYLLQAYSTILPQYLPSVTEKNTRDKVDNRVDINLTLENTEDIAYALDIPYVLHAAATVTGYSDEATNTIDIVANVPRLSAGDQDFNNNRFYVWGQDSVVELIFESDIPTESDFWNFSLYSKAANDSVQLDVEWRNKQKVVNRGEFKTITHLSRDGQHRLQTETSIIPTDIILSDSLWKVASGKILFTPDKVLDIDDFRLGNQNQYISIDGVVSKDMQDTLLVELKEVDLAFFSLLAGMNGFTLGGLATGNFNMQSVLKEPVFDAVLSVKDLEMNETRVGDAAVFATWDQLKEQVVAIASIENEGHAVALAEAEYSWKDRILDIYIDVDRLSINFLTGYFEKVLPNTQAYASGRLYIGGPLDAIRFEGRLRADDARVTVGVLGATYEFSDTIELKPYSIEFPHIVLHDAENNEVIVDGALRHNGSFKDFSFDLNVQAKSALVMSLSPGENDLMFGKAYADAVVRISGKEEDVTVRVNAMTRPGTKVFIQAGGSSKATDAGFIQFVGQDETDGEYRFAKSTKAKEASNFRLDLQLEATHDAEVGLIIDPAGGDMITGRGHGNIRVEYDESQSDVKMYGSYVIDQGNYTFTLDVFRKEFKIESGSSIYWSGSPSNAQVNIRAVYSLTASLKDLMNDVEAISSRTSVPVNCILILTDNLMTPTIQFDIDLPSSDEVVKQYVKSEIGTEEMMTRQILYLLVFNKFYTPEGLKDPDYAGTNDFLSLATSTVSSQMNNILSQMSNKISFGLDAQVREEDRIEWQAAIMYQPNDRWIVNGNFGYRDGLSADDADYNNRFITDFDVEYLLTKSGKLGLKFYNHTVDRAQLKAARNTQGIGIMYKEDFDTVGDLFKYYWQKIISIGKKKNKENKEIDETDK